MDININLSTDDHHLRVYYACLAYQAHNSFYQNRNFLVLPRLILGLFNSAIIPRTNWLINYSSHPYQLNFLECDLFTPHLSQATYNSISIKPTWRSLNQIANYQFTQFKRISPQVINFFIQNFIFTSIKNLDLTLLPVNIGTKGSFFSHYTHQHLQLLITVRSDVPLVFAVDTLISLLVSDLLNRQYEQPTDLWKIREEIGEFILYHSHLSKLVNLTEHQKTLTSLYTNQSHQLKYFQLSQKYLNEIHAPSYSSIIIDQEKLKTILSPSEFLICQHLINHSHKIITYDQLSQILYGQNWHDKFSLQYLAKTVENIRKKLSSQGYQPHILTQRNIGYGWFG